MMVNKAFSCVVGGSTRALSGRAALLTLLPEAGRQVVMMGLMLKSQLNEVGVMGVDAT